MRGSASTGFSRRPRSPPHSVPELIRLTAVSTTTSFGPGSGIGTSPTVTEPSP